MSRDLFGTDGVRGLAGEYPLDEPGVRAIGMAVGKLFAEPGQQIAIAMDTRESSTPIVSQLTKALNEVGVNVVLAGIMPTPGLAYCTRSDDQLVAGIMVTASHNPYQYNGIKVFDGNGDKLNDITEAKLNTLIKQGTPNRNPIDSSTNRPLAAVYEDFLVNSAAPLNLDNMKIAIDSANGAASGIAERVFTRLGASVTALFDEPNGHNINDKCGATDTAALSSRVVEDKLSLGIAVDGDADRLILIDSEGREVKGDHILYILATVQHLNGVVATVMSNLGLELALKRQGISLKRTDVGDRYVLEGLKQTGYKLGGEQSGHIILTDLLSTGDGLLAAVQTVKAISGSGKDLSQWREELQLLPQSLVNIQIKDKDILKTTTIESFITDKTQDMEGKGRLIIRPSGTEPLARVMVEADHADQVAKNIASELEQLIKQVSHETSLPFPNDFDNELRPIDFNKMSSIGINAATVLKDKGYIVMAGLTKQYLPEIQTMSLQPSIKEYCPKDSSERFANEGSTKKWLSKGRATYLLLHKEGENLELAGYGWVGTKESPLVPGGKTTFSLRVSENHQGKGLAAPFSECMLDDAKAVHNTPNIWLETWASNGGAVHIYHKIGFKTVAEEQEDRPTAQGNTVNDTRVYMSEADNVET